MVIIYALSIIVIIVIFIISRIKPTKKHLKYNYEGRPLQLPAKKKVRLF